jgi:putative transposase
MHVVQRGNNRQAVFFHDTDYVSCLELLFDSAERYDVSVHAFVCMTNHVHILVTPRGEGSASRMMRRLGASYTAGINSIYRRTGSLWEGRLKSSLVDSER